MYSIYANPEHVHLLVSRSSGISEEVPAIIITDSSTKFIQDNKVLGHSHLTDFALHEDCFLRS